MMAGSGRGCARHGRVSGHTGPVHTTARPPRPRAARRAARPAAQARRRPRARSCHFVVRRVGMKAGLLRVGSSNFRGMGGVGVILAILAFGGAVGGTAYISQQPEPIAVESPQSLVTDGSHSSPESAVKGFIGNVLLDNVPGACNYVLPDEQSTCNNDYAAQSSQGNSSDSVTGDVGVGNAVVNGSLALVPVVGKLCTSGSCQSTSGNGLPNGTSFQYAYEQAMNVNNNGNLFPCEELDGTWYVSIPSL